MLATLNSRQIVDEIVKDTVKDNDPHDAVQISPEIVLASRPGSVSPALAPEIAPRPEPKMNPEPKFSPVSEPQVLKPQVLEPQVLEPQAAAPSVDTTVRVAPGDGLSRRKRSSAGKWLRGAFVTFLFAGGSVAATLAWEKHGDTAKQMLAEWTPALASLIPSTSQTVPVATAQAAPPATQAVADQAADPPEQPPAAQLAAAPPAASETDATPSVQSMTRDLAAMAQQIEQLKANVAELKAGQEQMAREMTKPPAPKPVAETRPIDPRARVSAVPPRPAAPPVRRPKPVVSQTYAPAHAPAPLAPPPPSSQAVAAPPPAAPVTTTQAVADDNGPVVRPPMPVR
ncbi:hypothetical protein AC629_03075 [Bradyrhizobium sp. NAS80.1]|uniref:hypothetical protein n=1 Tax=Bradyrhizobium sp. NAS80.1 TaxID=1680159 RepID=UPI00095B8112|nr:hypothetical protein [Bradyrhizobium sp. NAS80.1]OKO91208.1 hypothetical protein AC629_03075 [Bradyrhizobium sp. NAS80.1]